MVALLDICKVDHHHHLPGMVILRLHLMDMEDLLHNEEKVVVQLHLRDILHHHGDTREDPMECPLECPHTWVDIRRILVIHRILDIHHLTWPMGIHHTDIHHQIQTWQLRVIHHHLDITMILMDLVVGCHHLPPR